MQPTASLDRYLHHPVRFDLALSKCRDILRYQCTSRERRLPLSSLWSNQEIQKPSCIFAVLLKRPLWEWGVVRGCCLKYRLNYMQQQNLSDRWELDFRARDTTPPLMDRLPELEQRNQDIRQKRQKSTGHQHHHDEPFVFTANPESWREYCAENPDMKLNLYIAVPRDHLDILHRTCFDFGVDSSIPWMVLDIHLLVTLH